MFMDANARAHPLGFGHPPTLPPAGLVRRRSHGPCEVLPHTFLLEVYTRVVGPSWFSR